MLPKKINNKSKVEKENGEIKRKGMKERKYKNISKGRKGGINNE